MKIYFFDIKIEPVEFSQQALQSISKLMKRQLTFLDILAIHVRIQLLCNRQVQLYTLCLIIFQAVHPEADQIIHL